MVSRTVEMKVVQMVRLMAGMTAAWKVVQTVALLVVLMAVLRVEW